MKRTWKKASMIFLILVTALVLMFRGCHNLLYDYQEILTSPEGTNTLVICYDYVSRPAIYKKGWLWNEKIWDYPGRGFMETVYFQVEWLSEDKIRFTYDDVNDEYDEEYVIVIPK